jgi:hypothetical protein
MTPTTTLPALRDAMTATELRAHQDELTRLAGPSAYIGVSLRGTDGSDACVAVYPDGILHDRSREYFNAPDWPTAINAAYAWIATRPVIARAERVRKMALAIIDIKDQDGNVTERRLRARDFTAAEIAELGAEACARAAELCLGAPFEIVT